MLAVIGVLTALITAAVQRARSAAARTDCANRLRQIGAALHLYHGSYHVLPAGMSYQNGFDENLYMSWHTRLLPFVEQQALWTQAQRAYAQIKDPFYHNPPHPLDAVVPVYTCPADGRPFLSKSGEVALTSYLGVQGTDQVRRDGVLFVDSRVRLRDVSDGQSNTLFVGERPPSGDTRWGYCYAGWGTSKDGTADMVLGVRSLNIGTLESACPPGPFSFTHGRIDSACDALHFWSLHTGNGGNFLFGDGSVRFLQYSSASILPALATRAGGEIVSALD